MVIVVGCSHPGIDRIVAAAAKIDPRIHLVAGGFHLVVAKDDEISQIVTGLREVYKVAYVAPGHCTASRRSPRSRRHSGNAIYMRG
jgi:7,8-dihydropterin-6-yl-methyl-4-(beta-D-ribofuranosyl)aminobenzene 5'-phosphate synthase